LRRTVLKNYIITAAQVIAELSIHLEDPVSTKNVPHELHRSSIHSRATIAQPLITESNAQRWVNDGVMPIRSGHQTTGTCR
jgi:hypothetical protein